MGTTTVGRILKEAPHPKPAETQASNQPVEEVSQHDEKLPAAVVKRVVRWSSEFRFLSRWP